MKISDAGLRFLMSNEGTVTVDGLHVMYDDGGRGVGNATIGYGHKIHDGPINGDPSEAPFINGLTDEQVYELLRADITRYEAVVDAYATRELNQNQYDALVDFAFNTGGGYPAVWAMVNAGLDPRPVLVVTAITPAFATAALIRRRNAEADLYNTVEGRMYSDEQIDAMFAERDDKIGKLYAAILDHASWLAKLYNAVIDHAKRLAALDGK